MEGVLYSDTTVEKTIDFIELLLDESCRNIWVWTTADIYDELMQDQWEDNVHISHSSSITTIGDCLRELYLRDESRDNLIIIGNTNINITKLTIHKNFNKKHVGVLLFGQGTVSIDIKGGTINKYQIDNDNGSRGQIMEIAYCTLHILSLFQDNFDCNTFHDLILSNPDGDTFGAVMDKRLVSMQTVSVVQPVLTESDFLEELLELCGEIKELNENTRLELNSLRLAYGLTFTALKEALFSLNRTDLIQ